MTSCSDHRVALPEEVPVPTSRTSPTKSPKQSFARKLAVVEKRHAGRTAVQDTPIAIRTSVPISLEFEESIRLRLGRAIGHLGTMIERGTVRFKDENGPRGGQDTVCHVKLVLSGIPNAVASARSTTPPKAFAAALPKVREAAGGAVRKRRRGVGVPEATPRSGKVARTRRARSSPKGRKPPRDAR
jgi:hypothetical protein